MRISAPQISRPPGKCKTLKFLYHRINKGKPQISPANNKFKGPQILTSLDLIFPFEMEECKSRPSASNFALQVKIAVKPQIFAGQ